MHILSNTVWIFSFLTLFLERVLYVDTSLEYDILGIVRKDLDTSQQNETNGYIMIFNRYPIWSGIVLFAITIIPVCYCYWILKLYISTQQFRNRTKMQALRDFLLLIWFPFLYVPIIYPSLRRRILELALGGVNRLSVLFRRRSTPPTENAEEFEV